MVYTADLKSAAAGLTGSSPVFRTISGYSIMDNTIGFYPMNVGSIPASRTKPARLGSQRGLISLLAPD